MAEDIVTRLKPGGDCHGDYGTDLVVISESW
jgi:hypothetical protein